VGTWLPPARARARSPPPPPRPSPPLPSTSRNSWSYTSSASPVSPALAQTAMRADQVWTLSGTPRARIARASVSARARSGAGGPPHAASAVVYV